jgi:hypothetical protein
LLSQIADEGGSREVVEQLAALLVDRPDLQEHYAQAMRLHMMLTHEMSLSSPALKPVVPPRQECRYAQELGDECSIPEELMVSLDRDPVLNERSGGRQAWSLWIMATTAAVLSMVAFGYGVWLAGKGFGVRTSSHIFTADLDPDTDSERTIIDGVGLMVRDARTMKVVSRLTRTSLLTSMVLPNCLSSDSREINLCSGVAWMERSPGDKERGYLLALPPGTMLDLYVDTDAEDQNALALVEIDPFGRMTGGTISFSNVMEGNDDATKRRAGCIGNYSVFNDSSFTKYFLFAGSHVLPRQAAEQSWYQSDYQVQYESEDLLVIGWDDSGYSDVPQPTYGDFTPDRDYNDIRAILRFSRPGESRVKGSSVVYSPQPRSDLPILDASNDGYVFDVKPGEQLVVMVSASALMPNSMYVMELPSRQVMWKLDGISSNGVLSQDMEKGTLIIRNDGDTVRQYQLYGRYQPGATVGDTAWQALPYKVLAEGDGSVTVGYEDSIGLSKNIDWNDIRVHARWFSE